MGADLGVDPPELIGLLAPGTGTSFVVVPGGCGLRGWGRPPPGGEVGVRSVPAQIGGGRTGSRGVVSPEEEAEGGRGRGEGAVGDVWVWGRRMNSVGIVRLYVAI